MKITSAGLLLMVALVGCSKKSEAPHSAPAPALPKPATDAAPAAPADAAPPTTTAAAPAEDTTPVAPELAPIQSAVEAFKERNNRLPNGIQELVDQKLVTLPKAPPGKAYFVNPVNGRVTMGNFP